MKEEDKWDANAFFTMMNKEYIVEKVEGIIHVSAINPWLKCVLMIMLLGLLWSQMIVVKIQDFVIYIICILVLMNGNTKCYQR